NQAVAEFVILGQEYPEKKFDKLHKEYLITENLHKGHDFDQSSNMPKHIDYKKQIPKTQERFIICKYCKAKDLPCDNKIPCSFCKLSNKICKRNYRISDKTKVLRKIFDAKINLLHTIEEAKLIFESLKEQHNFDKLYEILDNLQDTSDEESGYPSTPQQVKEYTPHHTPSMPV
ncbi:14576_t:CDS:2, partial [Racocetra persica]